MSEANPKQPNLSSLEQAVHRWRQLGTHYGWELVHQPWPIKPDERCRFIALLLDLGEVPQARIHLLSWLLEWLESLPAHGKPNRQSSTELWRCLADLSERSHDDQLLELFWQGLARLQPPPAPAQRFPLVGVPILNGLSHLKLLISSLDIPIETLAIVDQSGGRDDAESVELRAYLHTLEHSDHPNINRIRVARPFCNAGVAAAWNQILLSFPEAPMAFIINHDVVVPPGLLTEVLAAMDPSQPQFLSLFPAERAFSAFVITALAWDAVGRFDERFYPAYWEDLDYRDRLLANPQVQRIDGTFAHARMMALNPEQSATIAEDPHLAEANRYSFQLNRLWYFFRRRGPGSAWLPSGQWRHRWLAQWD